MAEDNLKRAKVAEQCERYEDMAEYMKQVVEENPSQVMSAEARNLFSVAYKNVVGARRSAWRVVNSLVEKAGEDNKIGKEYKERIEKELKKECEEVLGLLDKIIGESNVDETKVFFHKMKGDYHRYLSEVYSNDEKIKTDAEEAYKAASDTATKELNTCHPIRLGLALNFSVFYYEIMKNPSKAIEMAKKAFDDAIAELDQLQEDSYKDSTLIMQLLRDNLTLWSSESNEEEEGAGEPGKEEES